MEAGERSGGGGQQVMGDPYVTTHRGSSYQCLHQIGSGASIGIRCLDDSKTQVTL